MLDPDELYASSAEYRALLDELGENIQEEDVAERSGDPVEASRYGLEVWRNLLTLKKILRANSICELQEGNVTIYDLLYWAGCFADELHNAALIDKSFETLKIEFCEAYVAMHRDMLDKEVGNLGNVRVSLADSYYRIGKIEKADSLFREWLGAEPDWGWGWIGWSDIYWLWEIPGLNKDFDRAMRILKEGLSVPNVRDRNHLKERLEDLKKKMRK